MSEMVIARVGNISSMFKVLNLDNFNSDIKHRDSLVDCLNFKNGVYIQGLAEDRIPHIKDLEPNTHYNGDRVYYYILGKVQSNMFRILTLLNGFPSIHDYRYSDAVRLLKNGKGICVNAKVRLDPSNLRSGKYIVSPLKGTFIEIAESNPSVKLHENRGKLLKLINSDPDKFKSIAMSGGKSYKNPESLTKLNKIIELSNCGKNGIHSGFIKKALVTVVALSITAGVAGLLSNGNIDSLGNTIPTVESSNMPLDSKSTEVRIKNSDSMQSIFENNSDVGYITLNKDKTSIAGIKSSLARGVENIYLTSLYGDNIASGRYNNYKESTINYSISNADEDEVYKAIVSISDSTIGNSKMTIVNTNDINKVEFTAEYSKYKHSGEIKDSKGNVLYKFAGNLNNKSIQLKSISKGKLDMAEAYIIAGAVSTEFRVY